MVIFTQIQQILQQIYLREKNCEHLKKKYLLKHFGAMLWFYRIVIFFLVTVSFCDLKN